MKRKSFRYAAVSMLATAIACGTALAESGKATIHGEVNAGIQQTKLDGANGKFQEYRDIEEGVVLNDVRVKVNGAETPYYLDLKAKDVSQDDESYAVKGGVHGKYNFGLLYDKTPHNFSDGKLILNHVGGGVFRVADPIQSALQANEVLRSGRVASGGIINPADATNQALDAGMVNIVNNLYSNSANPVKYGLKRNKTGFSFDFAPVEDVKVWTKVNSEKRTGTRRINQGTYERFTANAGTSPVPLTSGNVHLVDYFLVAGVELPEVIDYRTTTMSVGAGVYKKKWLADAEYTFTNFENKINSLVWDNPFRLTSAQASGAGNATAALGDNGFNRGRSALGQITLSPDSKSHDISLNGSVELPLHSRFTGNVSYGWVTQDEAFDPYTLNSAIGTTFPGAGAPFASTLALPQGSLNGEVATLFQSYQLTSKPTDSLAVTARYRYYDYNNKSDNITFPGYAAFGDSYWRTERADVSASLTDIPVRNEALSFTRQNAEISVDYHVLKPLTLIVEGFWEDWDREQLRIDGTTEFGVGGGFVYQPARSTKLKGNYRYSHRAVDGYKPGNSSESPEAIGLQNYDWADRNRQKADLRLQTTPIQAVTVGLSGQYLKDEFGGENRFGLKQNDSVTGAIDVNYAMSDRVSIYASYAKDYRKGFMQSAAKDDVFNAVSSLDDAFTTGAAGGNFNPFNYWNSSIYEKVDTVGLGVSFQVIPEKLTLNTNYNVSYSKMDVNTYNPNGVPTKLSNATAQDWNTITNKYQELKADLGYSFTRNLKAGVTYMYELFMQDDFTQTGAYTAGNTYENSTKYLYTGANNFSYDAHVFGAYVNYKF
ncbi:Outer membrane protein [Citrifermentans bremense]|uniref:Outer membrane protein n=1 Tax=Citrifermentans bremense TaxID=60035 RepID=A0A6S6M2Q0_9BACT|nr:MtrB/PioB family decaheme-associated outer membrane protein [Citrifermentans bremense]BCG45645.1 Outer membrane protein [Citrifermentans bremense]